MAYSNKVADILANLDRYHLQYYAKMTFNGPSLYFHKQALAAAAMHSVPVNQLEYIYAALTAWGMHRMGKGGSKMVGFDEFEKSVNLVTQEVIAARAINLHSISGADWSLLEKIFMTIKIMRSGTTLVGNSKVMAHLMPNVVSPIDREYTLRYLHGNGYIRNDIAREWGMMKSIMGEFFIPIASDLVFQTKAGHWTASLNAFPWDTSHLKVIDNLVIGAL